MGVFSNFYENSRRCSKVKVNQQLIVVVNDTLRISLRVFVKIQNGPNKIQGARGKLIQEKTPFRTLKVMNMVYILTPVR